MARLEGARSLVAGKGLFVMLQNPVPPKFDVFFFFLRRVPFYPLFPPPQPAVFPKTIAVLTIFFFATNFFPCFSGTLSLTLISFALADFRLTDAASGFKQTLSVHWIPLYGALASFTSYSPLT